MRQPRGTVGVRDDPVAGVIGQFRGLRLEVDTRGADRIEGGDVEMRQDIGQQDRRGTLTVRRMLNQSEPAVTARDRRVPGTAAGGEIVRRVDATKGAQRRDHIVRHRAFIEPCAALRGDAAQHLGLTGGAKYGAGGGRRIGQIDVARRAAQGRGIADPVKGHPRRDGHALIGIADRGGEDPGQRPRAVPVRQRAKGVDGAGDRHRLDALQPAQRHGPQPASPEPTGQRARGQTR